MPQQSYLEIKNYIHNELGFTKEMILDMFQKEIQSLAQKKIDSLAEDDFFIKRTDLYVKKLVDDSLSSSMLFSQTSKNKVESMVKQEISSQLASRIQIDLKVGLKE